MIYVPPSGDPKASIMLVGEAPADNEVRLGTPFVGAAGYMLDDLLGMAGLLRTELFLTNLSRFQPPGNDLKNWIMPVPRSAKAREGLIRAGFVEFRGRMVWPTIPEHIQDLECEIKAVRPKVIVALGANPLWFLASETGISKWRGSILHRTVAGHSCIIIPTYHPAYLLRSWSERPEVVVDLRRAKACAENPPEPPEWSFELRPSFPQVVRRLKWLAAQPPRLLSMDIETRSQMIACVGLAWSATEAICIPFMCLERPSGYWSADEEHIVLSLLNLVLRQHPLVGQNFLYDSYYWAVWNRQLLQPAFDTLIAQNVLFPGKPKDLGYLASMYCSHPEYWKDEGREWKPSLGEEQLWRYNAMDCCRTWEIATVMNRVIDERGVRAAFTRQMMTFAPTLRTMLRGFRTSAERRRATNVALGQAIAKTSARLEAIFGHPVNPRSSKQMQDLFYGDLGIQPIKNRRSGRPTLDDNALRMIQEAKPYLRIPVKLIMDARTLGIFKSTFADVSGPANRFYYGYNPAGTETFRFSGSKNPFGWGTNPQNIPKFQKDDPDALPVNIRQMFVPDPGYVLIEWDLRKADLHVVAWEADDAELKQMLREGINVYKEGAKVVNLPYIKAKSFIHGTNYGGSARTMAINCKMTVHESETAQRRWFQAHPGIREWHRRTEELLKRTHEVTNRFGYRRLYFERIEGVLPQALAWIPQSTVGNVINTAFIRLANALPEVEVLLQTHDSLTCQIPKALVKALRPQAERLFEVVVPYPDPLVIPVDCQISDTSWGDLVDWPWDVNS